MQNKYTEQIKKKLKINIWGINNSSSCTEIVNFLENESQTFNILPGYIRILKSILRDLDDVNSIKWLNYFSQIRCAYFLKSNSVQITAFEKKNDNKVIDLELFNNTLCEIKSFKATLENPIFIKQSEEYVFNDFLQNKIRPAFNNQKADLLIVDDIFSNNSKNYYFLDYFLSFLDEKETERYAIIQNIIGGYLDRILVLSFTESMTNRPIIRYIGKEWKNILMTK